MTRITKTRLGDGRELFYFDDDGSAERPAASLVDHRGLPKRPLPAQLRFDALSREWVAVAAHRQSRTHLPPADQCPICPTTPANQTEIPAPDYDVAVFENRFPSLGPDAGGIPAAPGWGTTAPAIGRCEVVAFTPQHTASFAGLGWRRARTVIDAWAHRTEALGALPGIKQVFPFENRGAEIGVTLHHPHGQIYAYPYVTPRGAALAAAAGAYREASAGMATLTSSLLRAERSDGSRMVLEGEHFSAYVPFAARWPLEVHLVPHRQIPDLAALTGAERDELAELYPELLKRFDALYPTPTPYIAAWHQAPLEPALRQAGHLHLQLTSPRRAADKLKYLAGSEAAMGAFINDTTPESVAIRLREVAGATVPFVASEPAGAARRTSPTPESTPA
ncbi:MULTISPECIES: galactose-1-phosphate uridylyltransferase [unclassified Arthrobacter]|uniref:galactose-1-phosphate uridylyltransferase n=1 Tax=unclassified Arthrobacter TaxID=235627 RepID=UPI002DF82A10|nr:MULTISPECIES: galactose-1-phosphate uridylyltransferase [unclassified Arthrobacter]MEC5189748.1 UDPglucose--hexose-1-phosphate uridylyltransferase [Arthrobacter sp. MP_M4]MEC5204890.1 UDPglucose--hexose-1-phosphate uridylyltransferase [Arthrobacter sp. MP_M7]